MTCQTSNEPLKTDHGKRITASESVLAGMHSSGYRLKRQMVQAKTAFTQKSKKRKKRPHKNTLPFWRALQVASLMVATLSVSGYALLTQQGKLLRTPTVPTVVGEAPSFGVLLAGLDVSYCAWADSHTPARRCAKGEKSKIDEGDRTDTLIFIDFSGTQVQLLSLPRDTQVPDQRRKINASYKLGGVDQMVSDVERLLGKRIDYYAVVHTEYVEQVIDALGGLDVTIPVGQRVDFTDKAAGIDFHLEPGSQVLHGPDAVLYLRVRKGFGDDYGRMDRQKVAIAQLLSKLRSSAGLQVLPTLLSGFTEGVETNADPNLLSAMVPHLSSYQLKMATLPTLEVSGTSYLALDTTAFSAMQNPTDPSQNPPTQGVSFRLVDASGVTDLGSRMAQYLQTRGFNITKLETREASKEQSQVITRNRTQAAERLANFLGLSRFDALRVPVASGEVLIYLGEDAAKRFAALQQLPLSSTPSSGG
jgi:polyisoprenyl-teichoic acid--peptidoglycan teichoic acid transferase